MGTLNWFPHHSSSSYASGGNRQDGRCRAAKEEKGELEELKRLLPEISEKIEDAKESQRTAAAASEAIHQTLVSCIRAIMQMHVQCFAVADDKSDISLYYTFNEYGTALSTQSGDQVGHVGHSGCSDKWLKRQWWIGICFTGQGHPLQLHSQLKMAAHPHLLLVRCACLMLP